jgi:FlaA1/EpsC-like NDP-sugar epimerase
MNVLEIIGRKNYLFLNDIKKHDDEIKNIVSQSSFLVIGGAGSIGQAVTKEIFKRNPLKLHVVDINENNLVELVRDIRSSLGYITGDFRTFAIDVSSNIYDKFIENDGIYDFVLNLSALKHVRSEKDTFTLMRMIEVNILNTIKTIRQSKEKGVKKYFCVSTDKAANPVNMMGASKRIMELFLMKESEEISISTARFANVAFSDGSLLHGFNQRIQKEQPIVAPNDVKRYFVTPQESGELCLLSCLLGDNKDIFFPKLSEDLHLIKFSEIAINYLNKLGLKPYICANEDEARNYKKEISNPESKLWPCYFSESDTTGEKDFEEFYMENEIIDFDRFDNLGIVKSGLEYNKKKLENFILDINDLIKKDSWEKSDFIKIFQKVLPTFQHQDKGKYLDAKM